MASTYLTRTPASAGSTQTGTISFWVKKSSLGNQYLYMVDDGSNQFAFRFDDNNAIQSFHYNGTSYDWEVNTTSVYRDVSGWYHIVLKIDTTNATAIERFKLFVNGDYVAWNTTIPQNFNGIFFKNSTTNIGATSTPNNYFDGSMSHFNLCDGTAYDATAFGETDANGVWKIITEPSVTYGTNGFFILKDGNSVTDQSGNSNNWTVASGTLTNTEDNPSNVFATWNALAYNTTYNASALENGNTRGYGRNTTSTSEPVVSTLGASSGKYYFECKIGAVGAAAFVGISGIDYSFRGNVDVQYTPYAFVMLNQGNLNYNNTNTYQAPTVISSWGSSFTTNDIVGVAMDLDNSKFYLSINGTWQNSANPSAGTGGVSITSDVNYTFVVGGYSSPNFYGNWGNGYFGTTAVASAGTNASGIGIFEYDVPTGYTALSTKGLNL